MIPLTVFTCIIRDVTFTVGTRLTQSTKKTGYVATERPWYKDAAAGEGKIVFTPPYMSYANHYILSTISQLQPDKETVFAYDIKMGNIQDLIHSMNRFKGEQVILYNQNGTIIGSTTEAYLGSSFHDSIPEAKARIDEAKRELAAIDENDDDEIEKAKRRLPLPLLFTISENHLKITCHCLRKAVTRLTQLLSMAAAITVICYKKMITVFSCSSHSYLCSRQP